MVTLEKSILRENKLLICIFKVILSGYFKSNVVNLSKGDRKGRPYKCLATRHIRRGDLYGRPYLGGVINVKLTTLDLKSPRQFYPKLSPTVLV